METLPLISNVDVRNEKKEWTHNYDDSSSGYESTDTWDIESISSHDSNGDSDSSCDIEKDFARSCEIRSEAMKVCSPAIVCDSMKLILAMPDLCDVTFLVGLEETPVHGLRAVLSARSRVFQQLIFKHLHMRKEKKDKKPSKPRSSKHNKGQNWNGFVPMERLVIPIQKYDAEVFRMLIQFVHTGTAYITQQNVAGLLCGAVQFELPELAEACWEFIENCLISGRCESLLVPTRAYSQHETSRQIFDKIYAVLDRRFISPCQIETSTRKESSV